MYKSLENISCCFYKDSILNFWGNELYLNERILHVLIKGFRPFQAFFHWRVFRKSNFKTYFCNAQKNRKIYKKYFHLFGNEAKFDRFRFDKNSPESESANVCLAHLVCIWLSPKRKLSGPTGCVRFNVVAGRILIGVFQIGRKSTVSFKDLTLEKFDCILCYFS